MARLFIHIGAHKTGTSFVQDLFHRNRDRLARVGLHYPHVGPNNAHHALAAAWLTMSDLDENFFRNRSVDQMWDDLVERYAKAPGTVFLSAENLSRAKPQVVDFNDLARRVAPFEEVRIIYTLRQQAEMVQALWLQVAKNNHAPALHGYIRRAFDTRLSGGIRIDHASIYDTLLTAFSPEQILLLDYRQLARAPGGIGQAFLDLLGIGLRASDLDQPRPEDANISPAPLAFLLAWQIARGTLPDPELVNLVSDVLHADGPRPTTLLARHEYTKFRGRYTPGNTALVDRVQPWQPGFSFENPDPPDTLLYRDDITPLHWQEIAATLFESQHHKARGAGLTLSPNWSKWGRAGG